MAGGGEGGKRVGMEEEGLFTGEGSTPAAMQWVVCMSAGLSPDLTSG